MKQIVATKEPIAVRPDLPTFSSKGCDLLSPVYHGIGRLISNMSKRWRFSLRARL